MAALDDWAVCAARLAERAAAALRAGDVTEGLRLLRKATFAVLIGRHQAGVL